MGRGKKNPDIQRYIGGRHTPTYSCWANIKSRCLNPNHPRYKNYGGRGIKIYDSWLDYENFLRDMGEKPYGQVLVRIDEDGDFEPSNCYWDTPQILNNRNRKEDYIFAAIYRDGRVVVASSRRKIAKEYGLNAADVGRCLDGELEECDGWRFKKLTKGSDIKLIKDARLLF